MLAPTVSFNTVGCRLNQAETALMRAAFLDAGYRMAARGEAADVCVVHGCVVTAKAEQNSLRLARAARRRPGGMVVLAGCPVSAGTCAVRAAVSADLLADQVGKFRLPQLLASRGFPAPAASPRPMLPVFETTRAIVKIQDGCSFGCAYCIVPRARGPSVSRPLADIVAEVGGLVRAGFREIVLTGANIGCYADGGRMLVDLLDALETVPGLERLRLSSIEPSTVERAVLERLARSAILCRHLHLPLQSGSDRILRAMGRRYTARGYESFLETAAARAEGLSLGADVIAGFPGETDADFEATLALIERHPFANLHVFSYSRRPGTRAALLPDPVPPAAARDRAARLAALARKKREAFARSWLGRPVSVLVERLAPDGTAGGWTREYLWTEIRGRPGGAGALVLPQRKDIVDVTPSSVRGETLAAVVER